MLRFLAPAVLLALSAEAQDGVHWLALPAIGSAPETGLQYGAVVMRVSRPVGARRPSVNQAYGLFTAKHQLEVSLEHDGWSGDLGWRHQAKVTFYDYPYPFYGIGANAPQSAEEWFTARSVQLQATLQRRVRGAWYTLANVRVLDTHIRDTVPGGAVASGTLRGSRGGRLIQPGLGVAYDTRDDILAAEHGRYLQAYAAVADQSLGSDFSTTRAQLDARAYRSIGRGVLAAQAYLELNAGAPSFDQMSLAGSDKVLRGYAKGRYRDRALAATQVEWRAPLRKKLRYALFAGIGGVGPGVSTLSEVTLPTCGAGLRYRVFKGERSAIRVDYAKGKSGSSGLYISLNEAF
ncbi:MAG: BamA/TamA family outer membrane protein [Gemmatimonadaceae bacterium]